MSFLCWSLGFLHSKPSSLLKTITCAISENAFWDFYRSKPMIADCLRRFFLEETERRKRVIFLLMFLMAFMWTLNLPRWLRALRDAGNTIPSDYRHQDCVSKGPLPPKIFYGRFVKYIRNFSIWHDLSCSLKRFLKRFAMPFALKSQNTTYQRSAPCRPPCTTWEFRFQAQIIII